MQCDLFPRLQVNLSLAQPLLSSRSTFQLLDWRWAKRKHTPPPNLFLSCSTWTTGLPISQKPRCCPHFLGPRSAWRVICSLLSIHTALSLATSLPPALDALLSFTSFLQTGATTQTESDHMILLPFTLRTVPRAYLWSTRISSNQQVPRSPFTPPLYTPLLSLPKHPCSPLWPLFPSSLSLHMLVLLCSMLSVHPRLACSSLGSLGLAYHLHVPSSGPSDCPDSPSLVNWLFSLISHHLYNFFGGWGWGLNLGLGCLQSRCSIAWATPLVLSPLFT
jgi:hypothetical protein